MVPSAASQPPGKPLGGRLLNVGRDVDGQPQLLEFADFVGTEAHLTVQLGPGRPLFSQVSQWGIPEAHSVGVVFLNKATLPI
jgi:hypothetical protein